MLAMSKMQGSNMAQKTPKRLDWDEFYMSLVYLVAMKSKDNNTHIGAVIVGPDKEIRALGYNGMPRRVDETIKYRFNKDEKYYFTEHGERNAIYNAILAGTPVKGCTMYTVGTPCCDCARAIIQTGITEVVVDKAWDDMNEGKWLMHSNRTKLMFKEAGVKLRQMEYTPIQIETFRRGKLQ